VDTYKTARTYAFTCFEDVQVETHMSQSAITLHKYVYAPHRKDYIMLTLIRKAHYHGHYCIAAIALHVPSYMASPSPWAYTPARAHMLQSTLQSQL